MVLAAEHTTTIKLGTSIAVAFARNPMTVANVGWDLAACSEGRFILGLGSQIEPQFRKPVQHAVEPIGLPSSVDEATATAVLEEIRS